MVPVNTPVIGENEKKYVSECLNSGWISSEGPFVKQFETKFSEYLGREFGIAVSSGSGALDIAIKALDLNPGDEVIMPTFTIISPAFSIIKQNAVPVLVDSDLETWNMDVSQIEGKISSRTKAILVVHIYGLSVDMDPILDLCKKYDLLLIEDAAEMHGQEYKGKKCGSFGDMSIFSFYPNKHITTGEGGMVLTNDERLEKKLRALRNLSFTQPRRFVHYDVGWNYRMTNLQAAIGLGQLERIDEIIEKKRQIGKWYKTILKDQNITSIVAKTDYCENIYWVNGIMFNSEEEKNYVVEKLKAQKIGTRPFFWCMHEQPVFQKMKLFLNERYPNAEKMARRGIYLPSGLALTFSEVEFVCSCLINILNSINGKL